MLERSQGAPRDWNQEHTQAEVRRIVLDLSPDLVLLQELPGVVPYVETHDMIRANPMSHSGNLATLVGHDLMEEEPAVEVVPGVSVLVTFRQRDVTIANVHMAPGRAGAAARIEQFQAVLDACPTADLAIVGDTNTRTGEERAIADIGLSGPRPPAPTWDGRRNRFRGETAGFVAYFTRYFISDGLAIEEAKVLSEPVVIDGLPGFHLSDHFALAGNIVAADRRPGRR